jgi:general nucleoside transport system permease protein
VIHPRQITVRPSVAHVARWGRWVVLSIAVYVVLIFIYRQNPWTAFVNIYDSTIGTGFGWSQVLEGMIPIVFCAMAVTIPARVGQVNVGGEGQLWIGGLCATGIALWFSGWPAWALLTSMAIAGAVGGGLYAAIAGWLKARGWMNEVFSTVLLNYVAILAVTTLVLGPWHDPLSGNYPQTREIPPAGRLPLFFGSQVDVSILLAIVAVVAFDLVLRRTRWGLEIRAIGANPNAAERTGVPIKRFIIMTMLVGGALAGIAGMAQVSALDWRLTVGLSPPLGYGYLGFLVSWLAGHNPRLILPMAFLISVLMSSGTILQITQGLPPEIVNVLAGAVMLIVLLGRAIENRRAMA